MKYVFTMCMMSGRTVEDSTRKIPSEAQIEALAHRIYAKVRTDDVLGSIFASAISDWDPHLGKMSDFLSSVMRTSGRYKGNPMVAHLHLNLVRPEHFERWLELFAETEHELLNPNLAKLSRVKPSSDAMRFFS